MTVGSKLADNLVERVFGKVKPAPPQKKEPPPPRSVIAQLRAGRAQSRQQLRKVEEL